MFDRIAKYFTDPEDTDASFVQLTQNILLFSIGATFFSMLIVALDTNTPGFSFITPTALLSSVVVEIMALVFVRQGNLLPAKLIVPLVLIISITIVALVGHGLHDVSIMAYPLIIMVATLLQGRRFTFTTIPFVMIAVIVLGAADMFGFTNTPVASRTTPVIITICIVILAAGSGVLNLLVQRLKTAVVQAQTNEQAQLQVVKELQALQSELEARVRDRTNEIDTANQRNEKRAQQFEAIAQVARAIAANQKLEPLLMELARLISKRFDFYHIGIFLIDDKREFAVLRAANSEGGKKMLARGHRLGLGQSGIVGYVSATGKPRIALDVGADAAFFNNPDLPDTHSEMALPLISADRVIGVLDIQSVVSNAFDETDIDVLSTLADQVSIAIQNASSYEISQALLGEAQKTSTVFLRDSWRVLQAEDQNAGYQITNNRLQPLRKSISSRHIQQAVASGRIVKENGDTATLVVPLRIRGEVVGVMDIRVPDVHEWDTDEVDVAEAVAERLSLALSASLLLKSTQRRAEIERVTADISSKIGASTQFDAILRTAAEELSRALGGSEVLVQLNREALEDEI